ncbi:acyl-CoA dehydrogenase family protein [Telmatospirillum sp. J64-1]|uniref:acyl-CoA dehydrogenase family protein n=1 Tax=Telmatospirillum sp. J64-1 TaxID=2502183 RepID=UPI001C8F7F39|nr:acyl-CoA dehydrogenase family protein [Telmatospirillum sp. J64-1]
MDFSFSEDDVLLHDSVRRFAQAELKPVAAEIDASGRSATRHRAGLAELGIFGLNIPEEEGGPGVSAIGLFRAVEAIAEACASTASMVTAHYLATDSILLGADPDLRRTILPRAITGEALGAFALTEPRAGSNPADMRTRAIREGDGYRLTGVKHFISNAGEADFIVVYAITDPSAGHRGISAFVLDKSTPGIEVGPPENTMGIRGGHVFEVALDCFVPAARRIGAEGTGFRTAMKVLDNGRVEVAAQCIGIAQAALDAAVDWAKQREVGGHPIAEFQGLQWMIADMATELDAARLLGYRAAWKRHKGERFSRDSSMAKLFASEAASRIADAALQIHGGYGYTRDMPLERYVRDARIMRIYEGSSEIQRNIIARMVLEER